MILIVVYLMSIPLCFIGFALLVINSYEQFSLEDAIIAGFFSLLPGVNTLLAIFMHSYLFIEGRRKRRGETTSLMSVVLFSKDKE